MQPLAQRQLSQSLIITFSENRKDTLRSASSLTAKTMPEKAKELKQQTLLGKLDNLPKIY